jgi:aspartyl-tRNA(Asn)/glutamyl-tRNA(Gln) amidotransferase subunit C
MTINRDQISKLARLSRLQLDAKEIDTLSKELETIMSHVEMLTHVDTDNIEATTHVGDLLSDLRPDEPHRSLSPEEALKQAPEVIAQGFGVPKIVSAKS